MKTQYFFSAGKVITTILVVSMLSCMSLLTSCSATISTHRHVRSTVVIGSQGNRNRQERHERRNERREENERNRYNN